MLEDPEPISMNTGTKIVAS